MKSLNEYLLESGQTYTYRIKIAGELDTTVYDKFKVALDRFDVESCSKPKTTPIQKDPVGFPGLENQEINIFDIVLNYPASIDQVRELARLIGIDLSLLVVIEKGFNDSMNKEMENVEDGTRLENPDYPADTQDHKDANSAYADSYQEAAKEFANDGGADFDIAGKKTAPAKYNTDDKSGGEKSPMTKVKRLSIKDILK